MKTASRFDHCVENYSKYRELYPDSLYTALAEDLDLDAAAKVADVGAGTGNLSRLFIEHCHHTIAIEPNAAMLEVARVKLGCYPGFETVQAQAEMTTLAPNSVDLVVVGQAFHWFDAKKALEEFSRILKPPAPVALIWNVRRTEASRLMLAVERINLEFGTDYLAVRRLGNVVPSVKTFFGSAPFAFRKFDNSAELDLEAFRGKLLSQSYLPGDNHPNYSRLLQRIEQEFEKHQLHGKVHFALETRLFCGRLDEPASVNWDALKRRASM